MTILGLCETRTTSLLCRGATRLLLLHELFRSSVRRVGVNVDRREARDHDAVLARFLLAAFPTGALEEVGALGTANDVDLKYQGQVR